MPVRGEAGHDDPAINLSARVREGGLCAVVAASSLARPH
ncbi:MAG: hypothetical protein AVDCRST_MAG68-3944 [uncultured Gemmatimonadetes bacterium]|uniref:Uncharacterized protein n=1 Tax=uncultured Gemmatimonadota bacterium TaxID=203437 RepID=A0A6J4MAJ1_9BACT|nr:MAG: hypothetical protein AVDCRST_MAG68-3944 [uncultured Gemmatimonadota bacterium]